MGALPPVEHYVNGSRVYTIAEASDQLREGKWALLKRVKRNSIQPAGWINPRLPVYYLEELGSGRAPTEKEKP